MLRSGPFQRGGLSFGPGVPLPRVVKALLLTNVAVFFLAPLLGLDGGSLNHVLGLIPREVFLSGKIWQLFTYMFLHGGFFHLGFNMLMLWIFGSSVEHAWGSNEFAKYYLVCGVGAGLTQWITSPNSTIPVVGASGAIYGLMLAYARMYPDRIIYFNFFFPIPMKYFLWIIVGISLFSGLASTAGDSTAHFAHLGGMLFGWMYLKQDWRLDAATRRLRGMLAREKMRQNSKRAQRGQAEATSVDEILDKISTQGIDSLSERERKILREASRS